MGTLVEKTVRGMIILEDDRVVRECPCIFSCKNIIMYPYCRAYPNGKGVDMRVRNGLSDHSLPLGNEKIDEVTRKPIIFEPFPKSNEYDKKSGISVRVSASSLRGLTR